MTGIMHTTDRSQVSINGEKKQQLMWWRLLRPIMDLVVHCWACEPLLYLDCSPETSMVTGTIICPQNGKVRLCIQEEDPRSLPLLILDLPLHTSELATHIRRGMSRIVLQCDRHSYGSTGSLFQVPTWVTYCNGRRVGFATRRGLTEKDMWLLQTMRTVSAGAGILPGKASDSGVYKYLRGTFERVVGSTDSEAYHLIDPSSSGCLGQEFSVFFLRL